ncbi:MAG: hypothetical protein Q7J98_13100, partial [Kiritimatiellia bacterium]|nr:hypothetical protein [Kiritimatiellia bacterium]
NWPRTRLDETFRLRGTAKRRYGATTADVAWVGIFSPQFLRTWRIRLRREIQSFSVLRTLTYPGRL